MIRRPLILALALAGSVLACGPKKQPKEADTADTQPTATATTTPPPPPKCEKIDEKCEAKGGTKARIAGIGLNIEPVTGWTYAQTEKATVAQSGAETACFALAGHEADPKDAKKLEQARQASLEVLVAELGITLGKAKVAWKSPGDKLEVGALKLQVWELKEPVTRGAAKGDLLVLASQPSDGKALLAVAFVPKDDDQSGAKIMTSIQTLAPGDGK